MASSSAARPTDADMRHIQYLPQEDEIDSPVPAAVSTPVLEVKVTAKVFNGVGEASGAVRFSRSTLDRIATFSAIARGLVPARPPARLLDPSKDDDNSYSIDKDLPEYISLQTKTKGARFAFITIDSEETRSSHTQALAWLAADHPDWTGCTHMIVFSDQTRHAVAIVKVKDAATGVVNAQVDRHFDLLKGKSIGNSQANMDEAFAAMVAACKPFIQRRIEPLPAGEVKVRKVVTTTVTKKRKEPATAAAADEEAGAVAEPPAKKFRRDNEPELTAAEGENLRYA